MNISLTIYYSERDKAGNCYWAFTAYNQETLKEVSGKITGSESNIRGAEFCLRNRWPDNNETRWLVSTIGLPIRRFNRVTRGWPYAGCAPKDILNFIRQTEQALTTIK